MVAATSSLVGPPYIDWLYHYFDDRSLPHPWDAVAYHPYNDGSQLENDGTLSSLYKTRVETIRTIMVSRGDSNKPIWITEIGWDANPQTQANDLKAAFNWLSQRSYITIIVVHLLNDWNNEGYGLMSTEPYLFHTNLPFTAETKLIPKQPFYDAYKYYPKRILPSLAAVSSNADVLTFPETLHSIRGPFKAAWVGQGGLTLFGLPKTAQFYERNSADGHYYLVQYFERVRMEFHPETASIQFGLLGNQLLTERGWLDSDTGLAKAGPALPEVKNTVEGSLYFRETQHNLAGAFLEAWQAQGGLQIVGLPRTAVFSELNPDDGQTYLVQYFERARMELHPASADKPAFVLFGLLGNERLRLQQRLDKNNYPILYDYYNPALPEYTN
jgi:hypothetical protein